MRKSSNWKRQCQSLAKAHVLLLAHALPCCSRQRLWLRGVPQRSHAKRKSERELKWKKDEAEKEEKQVKQQSLKQKQPQKEGVSEREENGKGEEEGKGKKAKEMELDWEKVRVVWECWLA